jgi:glycosyltransferase involved in cell wall biosynthesis
MRSSLYISYDGLMEPLGQSQVLPYVRRLAAGGIRFWLLTFEKPADLARRTDLQRLERELSELNIRWVRLRYHKAPSLLATAWDVLHGTSRGAWVVFRYRARGIHARSYVAALIGVGIKALTGRRLIFDMRGFWPEERVEGGLWPAAGYLYRTAKWFERMMLRRSDAVIVLTEAAHALLRTEPYQSYLRPDVPVAVIPCCTDVSRFPAGVAPPRGRVLVYAGSVGTWYMLDEMLDFFVVAKETTPDLRLLMLNRGEHDVIARAVSTKGLSPGDVTVRSAEFADMPRLLRTAWAGLHFSRRGTSQLGSSPTKVAEYLAAGLPVIAAGGLGDSADFIRRHQVGVVLDGVSREECRSRWAELSSRLAASEEALRERCRTVAHREFSLDVGAGRYRQVYDQLEANAVLARDQGM